ncbi:MAG: hypothetical protein LBG27_04600 [Spirochaetaceae bacterium]|jgi:hypothetical protein|nr:hypothetical protein [Spirochaetaceae bacterium]
MKGLIVTRRNIPHGGALGFGFAACAAICVFALGISGCFTAADDSEVDSSGAPGPSPTELPFSGTDPSEEADSAIDLIKAAAGEDTLALLLTSQQEDVSLTAGTDLGATGLVLRHSGDPGTDTSPAAVILDGNGRTVQLSGAANGAPLITVDAGVTLTLRNITFAGISANTAALIRVRGGGDDPLTLLDETGVGHLILEDGAIITGNVNTDPTPYAKGGGVVVDGGRFTMNGGAISGHTGPFGGGVHITGNGIFTLTKGDVMNNTAQQGGGVYLYENGAFHMTGGEIKGNTAGYGGGVFLRAPQHITKTGGIIYGDAAGQNKNTATFVNGDYAEGHAVIVSDDGLGDVNKLNSTVGWYNNLSWNP